MDRIPDADAAILLKQQPNRWHIALTRLHTMRTNTVVAGGNGPFGYGLSIDDVEEFLTSRREDR